MFVLVPTEDIGVYIGTDRGYRCLYWYDRGYLCLYWYLTRISVFILVLI